MIQRAAPARRAAFVAGRSAARLALTHAGHPAVALPAHAEGDPIWPPGMLGSITHAEGWAIAVTVRRGKTGGIGVDLEGAGPLEAGVSDIVCRPDERGVDPLLARRGVDAAKLRFVAKEAWYKAVFPQRRRFVDFHEAAVAIDARDDRFTVRFVAAGLDARLNAPPKGDGGFVVDGALMCAFCLVPP